MGVGVILGILATQVVAPPPIVAVPGIVTTEEIADGAVTLVKLNPEVSGMLLASGRVTSFHIADGTIFTADIADGAVTGAKLATGGIPTLAIADGAVTAEKIERSGYER